MFHDKPFLGNFIIWTYSPLHIFVNRAEEVRRINYTWELNYVDAYNFRHVCRWLNSLRLSVKGTQHFRILVPRISAIL